MVTGERDPDGSVSALRKRLFFGICFSAGLLFIVVFQHIPVAYIASAIHDDAWFVNKAMSIAAGHWFGPYDQFALMKGPGYPLFLVLVSASGLPVAMAEAGLLVLAASVLCVTLARLTGAWLVCAITFVAIVWHPIFLEHRVMRDTIYPSQILMLLAFAIEIFFLPGSSKRKIMASVLFGLTFAWFWLTREEGVWIAPGLAILLVAAVAMVWRETPRRRNLALLLAVMFMSAAVPIATFGSVNRAVYGSFQLVDFKDGGFTDALDALFSVQVGEPTFYLPMPRRARLEVYKVSPHFAELRPYLDGAQGSPWAQQGCAAWPQTCGDIAGGWFVWAVRDAAADAGKYATPALATRFFTDLAGEVRAACASQKLTCRRPLMAGLPYVPAAQLATLFPKMWQGVRMVLMMDKGREALSPEGRSISQGPQPLITRAAIFLNTQNMAPPMETADRKYVFNGWYMDSKHGWFNLTSHNTENVADEVTVPRQQSPDLVAAFGDAGANQQRFRLPILCNEDCSLEIRSDVGASGSIRIKDLHGGIAVPVGAGEFYLDTIEEIGFSSAVPDPRANLAHAIRAIARQPYSLFGTFVMTSAFVACLIVLCVPRWRRSLAPPFRSALLLALVAWVLVASRILGLALIHVSLFPAVNSLYVMPAYYLSVVATSLSLLCFARAAGAEYRRRLEPPPAA